ncbi:MAG: hypothetical protein RL149_107 [Actinomycetota bacterium]|jgi:hypothetical protein
MTEQQPYSVLSSTDGLELRLYPAYVLVQVREPGDFFPAGNRAFQPLLSYISGNNAFGQKISMTAPVIQEPLGEQDHLVSFVMPKNFDLENLPFPGSERLKVVAVAEHFAAVIKFSGGWNETKFKAKGEELVAKAKSAGLETEGSVYWARFDPPFKPAFLKRNEALIRVKAPR